MRKNTVLYVLVQLIQKGGEKMFQLDYGDRRPLYEQIKEKFKELIISGALAENEKVPSVRELASVLAINPNTIQKAYKDLESEGYIYSLRAKGSFVSPQKETARHLDSEELFQKLDPILQELIFSGVDREKLIEHIDKFF